MTMTRNTDAEDEVQIIREVLIIADSESDGDHSDTAIEYELIDLCGDSDSEDELHNGRNGGLSDGTATSGTGTAASGTIIGLRPELIMKSIILAVLVAIIAIYSMYLYTQQN